jgi:hypothetical protein
MGLDKGTTPVISSCHQKGHNPRRGGNTMEMLHETTRWGVEYDFRVVDKIPSGYSVWNIGQIEGYPEYCPLCICRNGHEVIVEALLAVKMDPDEAKILLRSAGAGGTSLNEARKMIAREKLDRWSRNRIEPAIKVFEKYTS